MYYMGINNVINGIDLILSMDTLVFLDMSWDHSSAKVHGAAVPCTSNGLLPAMPFGTWGAWGRVRDVQSILQLIFRIIRSVGLCSCKTMQDQQREKALVIDVAWTFVIMHYYLLYYIMPIYNVINSIYIYIF